MGVNVREEAYWCPSPVATLTWTTGTGCSHVDILSGHMIPNNSSVYLMSWLCSLLPQLPLHMLKIMCKLIV
jgi:hypothetical protein